MAETNLDSQTHVWCNQNATHQYAIEIMLQEFQINITPMQGMNLFTLPIPFKVWYSSGASDYLGINNIVMYATQETKIALIAKVYHIR